MILKCAIRCRDVSQVADLAPLLTKEMDVLCGNGESMSMEEVVVQIHSAQVPNMELVDLPGKKMDHRGIGFYTIFAYG